MNPVALQHLKLLQTLGSRQPRAVSFSVPPVRPVRDEEIAQLVARQRQQYGVDHSSQFAAHGLHLGYWLHELEQDLYQDLLDYCDPDERPFMARLALGFVHNLRCNACVFPVLDTVAGPQPVYVMGVNLGLVQMAGLLCEALLWESENDFQRGREYYQRARNLFFVRNRTQYEQAILSDEIHEPGQKGAEISSLILRFIALHEFGHVVLGHAEQLDMRLNAIKSDVLYMQAQAHGEDAVAAMETAADRFAIGHMIKASGSPIQMWNNALFICALFLLLDHIEARLGEPLSLHHPPPAQRAAAIQAMVQDAIGPPQNDAMRWLALTMQDWKDA